MAFETRQCEQADPMTPKILLQLDTDAAPSTFDGVVAVDSGVDHLFRHGGVTPQNVTSLVHGAMFTRGGDALRHTAIFIGGTDVAAAERLLQSVRDCFFGPVRVSVMLDAGGCNTTAAAAVLSAGKHLSLGGASVGVLGGTGPVGQRVAEMAAIQGSEVLLASRSSARAAEAAQAIARRVAGASITPCQVVVKEDCDNLLSRCHVVIACGAAGVELIDEESISRAPQSLRVAIDLNAVPPAGIAGVGATDKAAEKLGRLVYGAIGVGGLKMKIHRQSLQALFAANDRVLDAAEVLAIGERLLA